VPARGKKQKIRDMKPAIRIQIRNFFVSKSSIKDIYIFYPIKNIFYYIEELQQIRE